MNARTRPSIRCRLPLVLASGLAAGLLSCRTAPADTNVASATAGASQAGETVPVEALAPIPTLDEGQALARALDRELAAHRPGAALELLERFVADRILEGRATLGEAQLMQVRPVVRFQLQGGTSHLSACKHLVDSLSHQARRERGEVRAALHRGDFSGVRRALLDEKGPFGQEVLRIRPELELEVAWLGELVEAHGALGGDPEVATQRALELTRFAGRLWRLGREDEALVAEVAAAELLESVGREEAAMERWLTLARTPGFERAHGSLRIAVAGRIESYVDRLQAELRTEIRAEERALAQQQVERVRSEMEQLRAQLSERLERLELELASGDAEREELQVELAVARTELAERTLRLRELKDLTEDLMRFLGEGRGETLAVYGPRRRGHTMLDLFGLIHYDALYE